MNIFISWSGNRSHQVAKLLKTWIKGVIQAARPWISSTDISSGTIWFTEIIKQLDTTTQGIICLTNENKEKPWILFEAGALANSGIESSRVYTLLVDIEHKDVQPPLAQFNLTNPDEEGMLKLMTDINSTLSDDIRLEKEILEKGFKVYWPEFKKDFDQAISETKDLAHGQFTASRTDNEILSEILDTVRGLDKRIRIMESLQSKQELANEHFIPENSINQVMPQASRPASDPANLRLDIKNDLIHKFAEDFIISRTMTKYPTLDRNMIIKIVREEKEEINV